MRKLAAVTGLALAAAVMSGCAPTGPAAIPTPAPSSTPVFASDEEALAAAEAAYAEYVYEVDIAFRSYDVSKIASVATGTAEAEVRQSVSEYQADGKKVTGSSSIDSVVLVRPGGVVGGDSSDSLEIYACLDISSTDVVGPDGSSVVGEDRVTRLPMKVDLVWKVEATRLLVELAEVWDGDDFC